MFRSSIQHPVKEKSSARGTIVGPTVELAVAELNAVEVDPMLVSETNDVAESAEIVSRISDWVVEAPEVALVLVLKVTD